MKTYVIMNPAAAGGMTRKALPRIKRTILARSEAVTDICITTRPLDAFYAAQRIADQGYDRLIVVGGDGTLHETVNGLASAGMLPNGPYSLGIIACGSGNGLAQSMGLPADVDEQIDIAVRGQSRTIDLARIVLRSVHGTMIERYFVNECQIGIGAAVVRRVGSRQKRIGGLLAYGLGTVATLFRYPDQVIDLCFEDGPHWIEQMAGLSIGNGSRTAAGMQLTPDALLDDGLLDVLVIGGQSVVRRFRSFPKIYTGGHRADPAFRFVKSGAIDIRSCEPVPVAADGEVLGTTPCSITVVPAALNVCSQNVSAEVCHATYAEESAKG